MSEKNIKKYALVYFIAFTVIWVFLTLLLRAPNELSLDTAENIAWSKHLLIAYDKHPFLGAFVIKIILPFFSSTLAAGIVASYLCLSVTLLYTYRLSRLYYSLEDSFMITLLTTCTGIYFAMNFLNYSQNSIILPFWVSSCFYFTLALRDNKTVDWIILAIVAALGMYAKLEMVLILFCLAIYLAFTFKKEYIKNIIISFVIFIASMMPLIWWMFHTDFALINYALNRYSGMHANDHNIFVNFILSQLNNISAFGFIALSIICILIFLKKGILRINKEGGSVISRLKHPLAVYGFGPLLFFFILQTYKVHIEYGWLVPIMAVTVPAIYYVFNMAIKSYKWKYIVTLILIFQLLVFIVYNLFGYFSAINDPKQYTDKIAIQSSQFWQEEVKDDQPQDVVGYMSIYITPFLKQDAIAYRSFDDKRIPANKKILGILKGCSDDYIATVEKLGYKVSSSKCITVGKYSKYNSTPDSFDLFVMERV